MKILGRREDGVQLVHIGAGFAVLMHAGRRVMSKPLELRDADRAFGLSRSESADTFGERQAAQRDLDRCRVVPLIQLTKPRSEYPGGRYPSEEGGADVLSSHVVTSVRGPNHDKNFPTPRGARVRTYKRP